MNPMFLVIGLVLLVVVLIYKDKIMKLFKKGGSSTEAKPITFSSSEQEKAFSQAFEQHGDCAQKNCPGCRNGTPDCEPCATQKCGKLELPA